MTIFCVRDGDSQDNIWNKPLKKVEQTTPAKPEYVPTSTPGIVQNTKTGKLETNFPELEDSRGSQIPLTRSTIRSVTFDELPGTVKDWVVKGGLFTSKRVEDIIAHKDGKRFIYRIDLQDNWTVQEDLEFSYELEHKKKQMRESMELSVQMMGIPAAMQVTSANTQPPISLSSFLMRNLASLHEPK